MPSTVAANLSIVAGDADSVPPKALTPEELTAMLYTQQEEMGKLDADIKALASETRDGFTKIFSMISDIVGTRNLMISTLVICSTAGVAAICSFIATFFRG